MLAGAATSGGAAAVVGVRSGASSSAVTTDHSTPLGKPSRAGDSVVVVTRAARVVEGGIDVGPDNAAAATRAAVTAPTAPATTAAAANRGVRSATTPG